MLLFRVTIPAIVPQRSEIPEGLMDYPLCRNDRDFEYLLFLKTLAYLNVTECKKIFLQLFKYNTILSFFDYKNRSWAFDQWNVLKTWAMKLWTNLTRWKTYLKNISSEFHTHEGKRTISRETLEGLLFNKIVTIYIFPLFNLLLAVRSFLWSKYGKCSHFFWWIYGDPTVCLYVPFDRIWQMTEYLSVFCRQFYQFQFLLRSSKIFGYVDSASGI